MRIASHFPSLFRAPRVCAPALAFGLSSLPCVLGVAVEMTTVSTAVAADRVQDKSSMATARRLIGDGQKALFSKDYATAIQKFRGAESLNHNAASVLGEARAMVGLGQLAQAQKLYADIASEAKTLRPPPEAAREAAALLKRVPHVTVTVSGVDAEKATVTIDSEPLTSDWFATPYAVDPGTHFVHGEAAGSDPIDQQVNIGEGESQTVALKFGTGGGKAAASVQSNDSPHGHNGSHTRRTVGEVILVGGVAGLAFGGVTGILASKKHSTLASTCPNNICTPASTSDIESYHSMANLSTVGFIAGGALTAVGAVLTFLPVRDDAPSDSAMRSGATSSPQVSAASGARGFRFEPIVGLGMVGGRGEF